MSPFPYSVGTSCGLELLSTARVKSRLGRVAEADRTRVVRYSIGYARPEIRAADRAPSALGILLIEQGRHEEAKS
jgi:hypothetical protein